MSWKSWKRGASVAWPVKLGVACLALAALTIAADASATTFYKWTDADGNVHYSDKPPKGFSGVVTPVEVDADAHTVPLAPPPETAPAAPVPQVPALLTQRRETRARLEHNLAAAREPLDLARKAGAISERLTAQASLAGWLHRGTRYAALNQLRNRRRRLANERQAMEQLLNDSAPSLDWQKIRPALDEARVQGYADARCRVLPGEQRVAGVDAPLELVVIA